MKKANCFLSSSLPLSPLTSLSSHLTPHFPLLTPLAVIELILVSGALCSCSTEFDPEIEDKPVTVVNVLAQSDSLLTASVSRSWAFNSLSNPELATLPDADVAFRIDEGEWQPMVFDEEKSVYTCSHRCRSGETVSVRADSRYGQAEGSSRVPEVVPIEKVDYTVETVVYQLSMSVGPNDEILHPLKVTIRYKLTFTDPGGENYYMVASTGYVDDPIIGENESAMDGVLNKYHYCSFFTDSTISMQTYTLSLFDVVYLFPDFHGGYRWPYEHETTIKLLSLSKDYYLYLLSLFKKYTGFQGILEDFGVADPRKVFSNVSSGAGIVAADAASVYELDLTEILEEVIKNVEKQ